MRFVPVDHRKTDAAVVNDGMNAIRESFLLPVGTDSSKHRTNVSRLSPVSYTHLTLPTILLV